MSQPTIEIVMIGFKMLAIVFVGCMVLQALMEGTSKLSWHLKNKSTSINKDNNNKESLMSPEEFKMNRQKAIDKELQSLYKQINRAILYGDDEIYIRTTDYSEDTINALKDKMNEAGFATTIDNRFFDNGQLNHRRRVKLKIPQNK